MRRSNYKRLLAPAITFVVAIVGVVDKVHGDEFRLKDGSKIVGTIVSYDDGSFKVQTSYGFAFVRKDSIAEIIPTEKTATPDSAQHPAALKPAGLRDAAPSGRVPMLPMPRPVLKRADAAPKPGSVGGAVTNVVPPVLAAKFSSLLLPVLSEPVPPGQSLEGRGQPMQEVVRGNLYVNQTYAFQMYKPPTWQLIKNPQNELPNAIGALGTNDQSTLLVIGHDPLKDSLEAHAAKSERTLRDVYENYRPVDEKRMTVAGLPAIEQRFYGNLDGHDWSVTVTTLARGKDLFTILGMTSADSDLIQIQENVIAKTIASLQFIAPH